MGCQILHQAGELRVAAEDPADGDPLDIKGEPDTRGGITRVPKNGQPEELIQNPSQPRDLRITIATDRRLSAKQQGPNSAWIHNLRSIKAAFRFQP